MASIVIWAVILVCMAVSLAISFWAGRRFISLWPKLAFFAIASVVGIILYPTLAGLSVGFAIGHLSAHYHAMRDNLWIACFAVVAVSSFGVWGLPKMMANKSN